MKLSSSAAGAALSGRAHAGRSNAMMNVTRYAASGSTQRNGSTAKSEQSWFVDATSSADANPGRSIQAAIRSRDGGGSSSPASTGTVPRVSSSPAADSAAKP